MSQLATDQLLNEKDQKIAQLEQALALEAALERVRSRIMWMQRSHELRDVVSVMYDEMELLGLAKWGCNIMICHQDKEVFEFWLAEETDANQTRNYFVKGKEHPVYEKIWTNWENQTNIFTLHHQDEYKLTFDKYWLEETDFKHLPDEVKANVYNRNEVFLNYATMKHGLLNAISYEKISDELLTILARFANVFEQTYTRFLDLQKVETQAREAQIEAALEKIRNRTLLMKDSSELNEAVATFFQQFKSLDLLPGEARAFFAHINEAELVIQAWMTRMDGTVMSGSHFTPLDTPSMLNFYDAWKNQSPLLIRNYEGEALKNYLNFVASLPHVKKDKDYQELFQSNPERIVMTDAFFLQGSITMMTFEPLSEKAQAMLVRFAKVFEFTYTRFLDLQKAETQAREAKIEASLERVRARTMAMHKSEELSKVATAMFTEFQRFNLTNKFTRINISILNEENGDIISWMTSMGGGEISKNFRFNAFDNKDLLAEFQAFCRTEKHKRKEKKYLQIHEGKGFQEILDFTLATKMSTQEENQLLKSNGVQKFFGHNVWFAHGVIALNRNNQLSDDAFDILQRFAAVFEQTYTRFLDLQKAEKQAQEIEKVFNENQRLLHSILPEPIAEQIRQGQQTVVKRFEQVSILFADIVGFTILSEKLSPQKVVDILNGLFSKFDDLTDKYGLEKIKTIGDAYMVAAGVPEEKENHALVLFQFAQEMLSAIEWFNQVHNLTLEIRIGISSGPVVAGVIGKKKFAYDLWGDTVNTAARMEAYGQASCIQLAPPSYELLKNDFVFEKIPQVAIKGKGKMDVYVWTA